MATELKDYIRCYDEVLSQEFCSKVIKTFEHDTEHHTRIDREQRPTFTEFNLKKRYLDADPKWMDIQINIQQVFVDYVSLYMKELDLGPDFPPTYSFEEYRIKRYAPKTDEFKDHVDVGDYASARRFLVCFLYLNNTLEGQGNTVFPKLDYSIQPKCGRLLIFPSLWLYRHSGQPLKQGYKYIVGSYLHYL